MTTYYYDGSFDGFLTAIFDSYLHKAAEVIILPEELMQASLFGSSQIVITDPAKSKRIWNALVLKNGKSETNVFLRAFLSDQPDKEKVLLDYCQQTIASKAGITGDFGNRTVLKTAQFAKITGREKHRMEAFIRFHLIDDLIYYANIEPDCDVLPLIAPHFKQRYADQHWIIYDLKRDYGIAYDLHTVQEIRIDFKDHLKKAITNNSMSDSIGDTFDTSFPLIENQYRKLWHQYFKSTNIASRKNMKLHVQHVPKRYWKYLSEKDQSL